MTIANYTGSLYQHLCCILYYVPPSWNQWETFFLLLYITKGYSSTAQMGCEFSLQVIHHIPVPQHSINFMLADLTYWLCQEFVTESLPYSHSSETTWGDVRRGRRVTSSNILFAKESNRESDVVLRF